MQTDKLIRGNIYLFVDENGEARRCMFERTVVIPNNKCGFRFRVEGNNPRGYATNLTKEQVETNIFRSPNVPKE